GERLAEHRARHRVLQRLIERTLAEAECRTGDGGAEDIERLHGELEAVTFAAEPLRGGDAAALERQRGERMRCDDIDAARDRETRSAGVDDEAGNSLGGRAAIGALLGGARAREDAVKVGDAAVRDPGLLAV